MSALELLKLAAAVGVTAHLEGEDTVTLRPAERVTPELLATLRAHRDEILEHLRRQRRAALAIGSAKPPAPHRTCPSCGCGLHPNDADGAECFTCRAPTPWWLDLDRMRVM